MTEHYRIGFIFRLSVFFLTFVAYLFQKEELYDLVLRPIKFGITPLHILWLVFMVTMLVRFQRGDALFES